MSVKFHKAYSTEIPALIEITKSGEYVYIRKNIVKVEATDTEPESYAYDEAILTKSDYEIYSLIETTVNTAINSTVEKRTTDIIDNYTLQLIEEGVI